jgi:hypothetical protein
MAGHEPMTGRGLCKRTYLVVIVMTGLEDQKVEKTGPLRIGPVLRV